MVQPISKKVYSFGKGDSSASFSAVWVIRYACSFTKKMESKWTYRCLRLSSMADFVLLSGRAQMFSEYVIANSIGESRSEMSGVAFRTAPANWRSFFSVVQICYQIFLLLDIETVIQVSLSSSRGVAFRTATTIGGFLVDTLKHS